MGPDNCDNRVVNLGVVVDIGIVDGVGTVVGQVGIWDWGADQGPMVMCVSDVVSL